MAEPLASIHSKDLLVGYDQAIAGPFNHSWYGGGVNLLLGGNGQGKSTLIKTILGLIPPLSGKVEAILGSHSYAYVPQNLELPAEVAITVADVVSMGLWGRNQKGEKRWGRSPGGLKSQERRARVSESLKQVGLCNFEKRNWHQLSGGQKRLALFARALISNPSFLALDEPLAQVDTDSRKRVTEIIKDFAQDKSRIVIMATHLQQELSALPILDQIEIGLSKVRQNA